ncbi:MAG: hypothetical protein HYY45_05220 [Deltaproteobacteria bacterium]|nr:hypothetical protein [Deltaproteobacteria bacterium]
MSSSQVVSKYQDGKYSFDKGDFFDYPFRYLIRGEGSVKKLNTYEFYRLGDILSGYTNWNPKESVKLTSLWFRVSSLRFILKQFFTQESLISPASKRAISALLDTLKFAGIPEELPIKKPEDWEDPNVNIDVQPWSLSSISQKAKELETVLANDLPGLATYYVIQKGLYSTDDLISHAHHHIPESLRSYVPKQAIIDINEAGKCLAFELPTASAFHMWRAVETVMEEYYKKLSGTQSFSDDKVQRNWDSYIKALEGKNAEKKITVFLDHIRSEYRNPVSHPSVNIEMEEAFSLLGAAFSVITQTLRIIEKPLALPLPKPPIPASATP